ncbi:MAG TPA: ATP-binding protein [Desulfobacterales bacterium]|nr:ATP-binding protein [Desulfobacterales bacterium]
MNASEPLYNSRLTKTYVLYLHHRYPGVAVEPLLEKAGIYRYQIEDSAHWLTQDQVDRFHAALVAATGEADISHNVGRFAVSSEVMGAAKQYILGLMTPATVYQLMEKNYPLLSRGAAISARKTGPTQVEITATPKPGVAEKSYQCANRSGFFEAFPTLFSDESARIEHPECYHRGDPHCRYILTWRDSRPRFWRRMRDISLAATLVISAASAFWLSPVAWGLTTLGALLAVAGCAWHGERLERKALVDTIEKQREAAEDTVLRNEELYNNALLILEMGQATSTILDIRQLASAVMAILQKRLDFDRGMLMLADPRASLLKYVAGFGHTPEQEALLRTTAFKLDNPDSRGVFILSMRERRPFLVNDIRSIESDLSARSLEFARRLGARALICVPVVYEKDPLGILAVDNSTSKRPLLQSDMNLLLGLASQLATSIVNATHFERVQESEKKYRELVETASSLILRVDAAGRITFVNEFAQRLFDFKATEVLGTEAAPFILGTGSDRQRFERLIGAMSRDPMHPAVRESEHQLRSGKSVWIAWTYRPILDAGGGFAELLCIGNDITELKRAEHERKELQTQLQRAQKMEAIGTLAGGVAHDLNNILSGIVSYPELLLMDLPEGSSLRKPIQTIKKSGERAAAIVQDLLTLARRGVETTEVVSLNQIIADYLGSPEFSKLQLNHPGVTVHAKLEDELLNIVGSPVHLAKTVMNLVTNAAEAMPDGGTIAIRTENRYLEAETVGYESAVTGDFVTLAVSDAGIGIPPEEMERIFEPFYTKKAMGRSGTGLGMAVVWGTVKDHRGHIDVKSTVGRGTDIELFFPATRRSVPRREEALPLDALKGRGESVLVVDDIREQREIASEILGKLGYAVETAASGEAAVERLRESPTDLVVLDMIMDPGIDGLETFRRILALRPGQKTIIASGYSESVQVREAQRLGAGAYVKKPYLMQTFGLAVRQELDRG